MELNAKNITASTVLLILLMLLMASIFQIRWLVIIAICLISLLMLFLSWQIGVKKRTELLAQNFGQTWGNFVAITLLLGGIALMIWILSVYINSMPLKY